MRCQHGKTNPNLTFGRLHDRISCEETRKGPFKGMRDFLPGLSHTFESVGIIIVVFVTTERDLLYFEQSSHSHTFESVGIDHGA